MKDAFHRFVVDGQADAVNPDRTGTKAAAYYRVTVPAEGATTVGLRLCRPGARRSSRRRFGKVFADAHRRGRRVLRLDHPGRDSGRCRWR